MAKLEGEDFFQKLQQNGEGHGITPASESKLNLVDLERPGATPSSVLSHELGHGAWPGGNEWTSYADDPVRAVGAVETQGAKFTNPNLLKALDEVGVSGESALASVPKAFDLHSAISHFEATDVIAAHKELTSIAGTVAEAGDTNPQVTRALSGLRDILRPSAVTYDDLASAAWQATTQGKMMELGRVLAADGWESEAATVLKLMPK